MLNDYKPSKGSVLLIPSGTSANPDGKHLFFVLTNPCPGNQHLAVSISTLREDRPHDATCIVEAGEHSFVERDSYVLYRLSRQIAHSGIIKCVKSGLFVPKDDCENGLLERIRNGIINSPMTPRWAKEYFRTNRHR